LNAGLLTKDQFSVLVTVVVLSAVVPTWIAQRFFAPATHTSDRHPQAAGPNVVASKRLTLSPEED
jgi:hypothetical protein